MLFVLISDFGYWNVVNSSLEDTLFFSENVVIFLLNVTSGVSSNYILLLFMISFCVLIIGSREVIFLWNIVWLL